MTDLTTNLPGISKWSFIIGADAAANLATWHHIDELRKRCTFVAVTRPGHALVSSVAVQEVPIPALDISSTDIRRRVSERRQIRYLVPEPVRAYISKSALYRNPDGGSDEC
nr:nicotinate-nucleotide adenylyltransferase [Actinomycetes bacterium]